METVDYILAWLVYLIASVAMSFLFWKIIKKIFWTDLAYVMQVTFMAIIFTPWYVEADGNVLAPAIIIFVMDIVTIETVAGIRSLVPIAMAILLSTIITMVGIATYRVRKVRRLLSIKKTRRTRKAA
jgi:energy-coupling factor transporter transmembrane protein EcfT